MNKFTGGPIGLFVHCASKNFFGIITRGHSIDGKKNLLHAFHTYM